MQPDASAANPINTAYLIAYGALLMMASKACDLTAPIPVHGSNVGQGPPSVVGLPRRQDASYNPDLSVQHWWGLRP